jgi:hypothetical protein
VHFWYHETVITGHCSLLFINAGKIIILRITSSVVLVFLYKRSSRGSAYSIASTESNRDTILLLIFQCPVKQQYGSYAKLFVSLEFHENSQ